jgi:hypothetical protein
MGTCSKYLCSRRQRGRAAASHFSLLPTARRCHILPPYLQRHSQRPGHPRFQFRHFRCLPIDSPMLTARAPLRMPPTAVPPLPPAGLPLNAPAPSNYYENGRMYGGFRKGKYMFPNDEVIWGRFGVSLWEEWANMGFCTGRDGSHGYLSQILFGRKTRSSPFDSLYTELR